ncbi:SH3 domain-containing protein [Blastomonas sp.]|uniref:SH3 domain-containing protein n=1 Tax=Blastomonas sp. TaxID=1909299 RepID=UPI00391D42AF
MQGSLFKRLLLGGLLAAAPAVFAPAAVAQAEVETPYWASIQRDKAFARAGPMASYQIEWVFQRKNLPVKVVKRYGVWRQIEDPDGWTGWMHANMLSRKRTAIVKGGVSAIRSAPQDSARLLWRAEPGVVGMLGDCDAGWCEFAIDRRSGWVRQDEIWGGGAP